MTALIIFDSAYSVPPNVAGIFGLDNFAELIIKKRSLRQRLSEVSQSLGWGDVVFLDGGLIRSNVQHRVDRVMRANGCIIYMPSYVHLAASDEQVCEFLQKMAFAMQSVMVHGPDLSEKSIASGDVRPNLFVLREPEIRAFLSAQHAEARHIELQQLQQQLPTVAADFPLLDLRLTEDFLQAVTSTFDARHFNRVTSADRYTITKYSTNAVKLQQEYDFLSSLPARMRRFFVEPFDFKVEGDAASYRMERLLVPDFALQWLHNSVRSAEFEQFVRHIFYFLDERDQRACTAEQGRITADHLYVNKVRERVQQLKVLDGFKTIAAQAELAFGGVDAILARYVALYEKLAGQRSYTHTSLVHGDLCFSNILYNGALGTLKLIDPRGAASLDGCYADPCYDLAKLSHSIEGFYDYINVGQFAIELDANSKPRLRIHAPARHQEALIFRKMCQSKGVPPRLVRLYEASLFISMTPLHIESPLKVLAFLLNADAILNSVADDAQWKD